MGDANPIRTLGDYSKPSHESYKNTIELPDGNNVGTNTIKKGQNPSKTGQNRAQNGKRGKDNRESSHWQYKFPLPVEGVPTARRMVIPLQGVCTAMMKKLPVKEKWQLH
nr:hypothetical protein [Tanacetum cinerariifolium]